MQLVTNVCYKLNFTIEMEEVHAHELQLPTHSHPKLSGRSRRK